MAAARITSAAYLQDSVDALQVRLTEEDITYPEELYVPHPVMIPPLLANPPEGVLPLNEKK